MSVIKRDKELWRYKILESARTWVGTAFRHQGRCKRTETHAGGCDCLGLILGVFDEIGWLPNDKSSISCPAGVLPYDYHSYGHRPDTQALQDALCFYLSSPIASAMMQPGDIALCACDGAPQHLAIVSDYDDQHFGLIHAYAPARKVVEHVLDKQWEKCIVSTYTISELAKKENLC